MQLPSWDTTAPQADAGRRRYLSELTRGRGYLQARTDGIRLALIKRYAELVTMRTVAGAHATRRGYEPSDAELLASMGTASGDSAVPAVAMATQSRPTT